MAASAGDAHPFPIYNARFRVVFPLLDADGDLVTGAATPDSEFSKDQATFADCTNEMTEIATSSGMYYLDLIATELDAKCTAIICKSATAGMKTTPLVFYPRRLPVLRTGTAQAGGGSTITLDSGASAIDSVYNGCYVNITNNSPSNAQGQARRITGYVGSTKVATVATAWGTNPSSASTFELLLPGDVVQANAWGGTEVSPHTAGYQPVTIKSGTGTGELDITAGVPKANATQFAGQTITAGAGVTLPSSVASPTNITAGVITTVTNLTNAPTAGDLTATMKTSVTTAATAATPIAASVTGAVGSVAAGGITAASLASDTITAAKIAADAITAAKIADGAIDAATFAAGAINAAAIAADAITDAKVASDVTIASVTGAVGSVTGAVGSVTGAVGSVTGNVGGNVVGSVASVTAGVTLAAAAVQAIWDALTSALTTAGSIGKLLVDNINATVSSRATPAQVNTEADTALADAGVTTTVTGRIDAAVSTRLAAANITLASGKVTVGTNDDKTGYGLSAAAVQAVWDALTSALTTVGSIGKLIVDNLNATVSSRSSHSAADVWAAGTRTLTAGTNIVLVKGTGVTGFNDLSAAQVNTEADTALADYDPPTRAELTTDTNSILSKLLKYFQLAFRKDAAIATDNVTEVTAINATGGSGAGAYANTTDSLEALRDNTGTAGAGLTAADDAVITALGTLQTSVDDVPTNAELATALAAADDAVLAQVALVKAKTDALPSDPADQSLIIAAADALAVLIGDVPTNAELATALGTADDAVLAQVALVKATTDKLDDALEDDAGTFRFTANALEQAPTGGSAPTVQQIVDGVWDETLADHLDAGSTGAGLNAAGGAGDPWATVLPGAYGAGTAGKIIGDNVNATIGSRATQTSVDDLPTNTELATALGTADDAILAAIAALNNLSQANIRTAIGLATANLDTQLDALPTNSELATALGTADDAVLAAIAALNNLSVANIRTAVGLASANLDTQLADLPTNSELATALGTADDAVLAAIAALNNISAAQVNTQVDLAIADAALSTAAALALAKTAIDAIKLKTDTLPASPAAIGSAMTLGTDAVTAASVSAAAANKIADHGRRRTQANVEASSDGDALSLGSHYGAIQQMQEAAVVGATLTVNKTDGTTALGTKTLTSDAAADPIIGVA